MDETGLAQRRDGSDGDLHRDAVRQHLLNIAMHYLQSRRQERNAVPAWIDSNEVRK